MKNLRLIFSIAIFTVLFPGIALAQQSSFVAGKDYDVVAPKSDSEPVLEEFFNYACGHCYSMESFIANVKSKNPGLKVKMVPVELRPAWKIYVKAYFLGEKLGVLEKSHGKIFHRLHVEKKFFKGEQDMKDFFISLGVDEKAYDDVANSYWLNTQMRLAKQYSFKNKISATPTFLVNKRFKLNNSNLGSMERVESAIVEFSGVKKQDVATQ